MRAATKILAACGLALVLGAAQAWSQEQGKDPRVSAPIQPFPPASSEQTSGNSSGQSANTAKPDTRPVSGVEQLTLGSVGSSSRSFVLSRLHFRQLADTDPGGATGTGSRLDTASQLSGEIVLQRVGSRGELDLAYSGGKSLYNTRPELNQTFHQFFLAQSISHGRWALFVADQVSYLPESSFGFGGFNPPTLGSGSGAPLGPLPGAFGLNPVLSPSQTILTGLSRRISNSAVGQLQYKLSAHTSFTAAASYGFLRFLDGGFIDSSQAIFHSGYSRNLNRSDSLGLDYGFTRFAFPGIDRGIETHSFHVLYGHRITGRLAFRVSAGPRLRVLRNVPLNSGNQISWSMGSMLRYHRDPSSYGVSYTHGVTGGSGLFLGATTDNVHASYDRRFSRSWSGGVDFGYARNAALRDTNLGLANSEFRALTAGATLNRTVGRYMSLSFRYGLQQQSAESSVCITGSTCGRVFLRHQFGLSFDFTFRTIQID